MFERILLPTDGSEAVEPAIEAALDIAARYDATLHVLYIVDASSVVAGAGDGFTGIDNLLSELEASGREAADKIVARAESAEIEAQTAVRQGSPREDILTYAAEQDVDLIVMGTHGRTGVKRTLLGSVTEAVVRHAEIPVMTVHRTPEA